VSGKMEMWRCNEDGSGAAKMKSKEWVDGQSWQMTTDPGVIGGFV
jgi:hypothetical protein